MTTRITYADLGSLQGISPKLLRAFAELFVDTAAAIESANGAVEATGALQNATAITLSPNAALNNERILNLGTGFTVQDNGPGETLDVSLTFLITTNGGYACTFNLLADTNLNLPPTGTVPSSAVGPYADDTAAAAAGVAIGEWYGKTGGTVAWRVT